MSRGFQGAQELTSRSLEPSIRSFNSALNACARAGQLARARRLLDGMVGAGIQPDAASTGRFSWDFGWERGVFHQFWPKSGGFHA